MTVIPCLDLKRQHQLLKTEIFEMFDKIYDQTAFSGGSFVEAFEKQFSKFVNSRETIAVNNGTTALHLALLALGVKQGDEIILPANTFIATAWSVSYCGAIPVFVDCKPDTWEIDPALIEAKITSKTKGVIGVHLYGQPFDFDAVKDICDKHGLFVVEDAAQAQGASYKGRQVGSLAEIACFSFYPGKNLGACGEAGGITTSNSTLAERLRSLRNHGSKVRYYHDEIGYNYRMGGLEAGSLSVKLKYLREFNNKRSAIAERYFDEITNPKITFQYQPGFSNSVYHLLVVTTDERDEFIKYLNQKGINPGLHYPVPCHLQNAYKHLGYKVGDFLNSEYLAAHCVSLPMFPEMTDEEIQLVIDVINKY